MKPIAVSDIRAAAIEARDSGRFSGLDREYKQSGWDCGTSCCIWGAAHLRVRGVAASDGPNESERAALPAAVVIRMYGCDSTPAQIIAACDELDVLAECARAKPWTALRFAAALLPPELLAECARAKPWTALEFAAALLPPELLAECKQLVGRA